MTNREGFPNPTSPSHFYDIRKTGVRCKKISPQSLLFFFFDTSCPGQVCGGPACTVRYSTIVSLRGRFGGTGTASFFNVFYFILTLHGSLPPATLLSGGACL